MLTVDFLKKAVKSAANMPNPYDCMEPLRRVRSMVESAYSLDAIRPFEYAELMQEINWEISKL